MTATPRELGIGEDQGQARTRGAWMLKPDAFGAMTAILDVPAQRRRKPRGHNGLTGDCRHRDPQNGKSGRNNKFESATALDGIQPNGGIRADTMVRHVNRAHWGRAIDIDRSRCGDGPSGSRCGETMDCSIYQGVVHPSNGSLGFR